MGAHLRGEWTKWKKISTDYKFKTVSDWKEKGRSQDVGETIQDPTRSNHTSLDQKIS